MSAAPSHFLAAPCSSSARAYRRRRPERTALHRLVRPGWHAGATAIPTLPQVPVRQWVVTFPTRLRFFLNRDPVLLGRVQRIVLRAIETGLRSRFPDAPRGARCGAVTFVPRFGSALDAQTHLHCCVTDGVFACDANGTPRA